MLSNNDLDIPPNLEGETLASLYLPGLSLDSRRLTTQFGSMTPIIRAANANDASGINDIYNHYICHSVATFDLAPWSLEKRLEWFKHQASSNGWYTTWVAEAEGRILGFACNGPLREKAAFKTSTEVSVYLDPAFVGQGLGTQLFKTLMNHLPNYFHRAYAAITLPNQASITLHQHFGFKECGVFSESGFKFDKYWDVGWLEWANEPQAN